MPLTRDEIMTIPEAIRQFELDPSSEPELRKRLQGKHLRHLGEQAERGWFYRVDHIIKALAKIQMSSPHPTTSHGRTKQDQ